MIRAYASEATKLVAIMLVCAIIYALATGMAVTP